jgi:dihydropteroate synthase
VKRQPHAVWPPRANLDLRDISPHITTALLAIVDDPAAADAAIRAGADMLDLGHASPEAVTRVRGRHPGTLVTGYAHTADVVRDAATARRAGAGLICDSLPDAAAAARTGIPRDAILVAVPPVLAGTVATAGWAVLAEVDEALPGTPGAPAASPEAEKTPTSEEGETAATGEAMTHPGHRRPDSAASLAAYAASLAAEEARTALSATAAAGCAHPAATVAAAAICAWLGIPAVRTRHVKEVRRALDMTASIMGTRPPAWTLRGLA